LRRSLLLLATVQLLEEVISGNDKVFLRRKIVRLSGGSTEHLGKDLLLLGLRQGVVLVHESLRGAAHECEFTPTLPYVGIFPMFAARCWQTESRNGRDSLLCLYAKE
jgi:hypothetical protein